MSGLGILRPGIPVGVGEFVLDIARRVGSGCSVSVDGESGCSVSSVCSVFSVFSVDVRSGWSAKSPGREELLADAGELLADAGVGMAT